MNGFEGYLKVLMSMNKLWTIAHELKKYGGVLDRPPLRVA